MQDPEFLGIAGRATEGVIGIDIKPLSKLVKSIAPQRYLLS